MTKKVDELVYKEAVKYIKQGLNYRTIGLLVGRSRQAIVQYKHMMNGTVKKKRSDKFNKHKVY